ncbi:MAG: GFA family protein [Actinomycetota bacterium]
MAGFTPLTGGCLCGAVRWQVDGDLGTMSHCHCSMCRKAHGAPFATYVSAASGDFRWLSGEESITTYESSPGFVRAFCGHCGSVVPDPPDEEDHVFIPAGCLDGDPGVRPASHIFAATKAPWHIIGDALPRHDAYPNPDDGPDIDRPAQGAAQGGFLHGSCLCGDIAYEVTEPLKTVHNCHCTRCQKARAAAHTTNGFTSAGGVTFVLCEGDSPASNVSQYIEHYGPGVQHIALEVVDQDDLIVELGDRGAALLSGIFSGAGIRQSFTRRDERTGLQLEFVSRTDNADFDDGNVADLFMIMEKENVF